MVRLIERYLPGCERTGLMTDGDIALLASGRRPRPRSPAAG
jgi:hypothetical protein